MRSKSLKNSFPPIRVARMKIHIYSCAHQTIGPLSDKFNITADPSYGPNDSSKLAKKVFHIIKSGHLCGKVILISWKHSTIPHLAAKLGCGPKQGCPLDYPSTTFDLMLQIKYSYGFDPLQYSKAVGDYVPGGTSFGGRWMSAVDFVEMREGKNVVKIKPPSSEV
eukprot:6755966-Ditylum_brightwellii.AAC.1